MVQLIPQFFFELLLIKTIWRSKIRDVKIFSLKEWAVGFCNFFAVNREQFLDSNWESMLLYLTVKQKTITYLGGEEAVVIWLGRIASLRLNAGSNAIPKSQIKIYKNPTRLWKYIKQWTIYSSSFTT